MPHTEARVRRKARPALTEARIRKAGKPKERPLKLFDKETGLYLLVRPSGAKYWRVRITKGKNPNGKNREQHLTLGVYPTVSRDEAVTRAAAVRQAVKAGGDGAAVAAKLRGAKAPPRATQASDALGTVAERWLARQDNAKSTMERDTRIVGYLFDALGKDTPIDNIDRAALRAAVLRIEQRGRETAARALMLAKGIWEYAVDNEFATEDPAAALRSKTLLAKPNTRSFAAVTDPPRFAELLRAINNYGGQPVTKLALQVLACVFTRPGELRLATWSEFTLDGDSPQWMVPVERMKMRGGDRTDHIVPLATQVVTLLRELRQHRGDDGENLVFPSLRKGRPLSDNTLNMALRNMGYDTQTQHCSHGFRSSASTLLHERGFDKECIETQLAHARPGVGGIYNRSHLLEQRRAMMQSWADYLDELVLVG